jgi:hypothetical protein
VDTPLEAATQALLDGGAPAWLAEGQAEQFRYRCPGKTVPRDIDHRGYRPETSGDVRRFRARVRSLFSGREEFPNHGGASLVLALIGRWTNNYAIYRSS